MSRFFNSQVFSRLPSRYLSHVRGGPSPLLLSYSLRALPRRLPTIRYNSTEAAPSPENQQPDQKPVEDSETSRIDPLVAKLEEKEKEVAKLKDSLLRSLADFENLQKITKRDALAAKDFAIQSFAKELVSSIDILALALSSVEVSKRADKEANPDLVNLWEGVNLTKVELEKVLSRFGVTPFDPTGQKFDPNIHEALYQAPVPGKEPGSVLECQKIGYMIKDRLLRPAQVGVVLGESQ